MEFTVPELYLEGLHTKKCRYDHFRKPVSGSGPQLLDLRTIKLKKKGYGSKSATSIFKFVHAFGC
jgi:hypothetical protein